MGNVYTKTLNVEGTHQMVPVVNSEESNLRGWATGRTGLIIEKLLGHQKANLLVI